MDILSGQSFVPIVFGIMALIATLGTGPLVQEMNTVLGSFFETRISKYFIMFIILSLSTRNFMFAAVFAFFTYILLVYGLDKKQRKLFFPKMIEAFTNQKSRITNFGTAETKNNCSSSNNNSNNNDNFMIKKDNIDNIDNIDNQKKDVRYRSMSFVEAMNKGLIPLQWYT